MGLKYFDDDYYNKIQLGFGNFRKTEIMDYK
jgi:hypothetical protein